MDKLNIDFNHCFTAYQREILGDDKCKQIALNILRRFDIGLEIKKTNFSRTRQTKIKGLINISCNEARYVCRN